MQSAIGYIFTFGIPLLGIAICILGGFLLYRAAKSQRISRKLAALAYCVATSTPFILAWLAVKFGYYLAHSRNNYAFAGEGTWGLHIFMTIYLLIAIVCNLIFWIRLALLRKPSHQNPRA